MAAIESSLAFAGIKRRHQPLVAFQRELEHLFVFRGRLAGDHRPAALRFVAVVKNSQLVVDDVALADDALNRPRPLIVDIGIEHGAGADLNHAHLAAGFEHRFMDDAEHLAFGHARPHPIAHGAQMPISPNSADFPETEFLPRS